MAAFSVSLHPVLTAVSMGIDLAFIFQESFLFKIKK